MGPFFAVSQLQEHKQGYRLPNKKTVKENTLKNVTLTTQLNQSTKDPFHELPPDLNQTNTQCRRAQPVVKMASMEPVLPVELVAVWATRYEWWNTPADGCTDAMRKASWWIRVHDFQGLLST